MSGRGQTAKGGSGRNLGYRARGFSAPLACVSSVRRRGGAPTRPSRLRLAITALLLTPPSSSALSVAVKPTE